MDAHPVEPGSTQGRSSLQTTNQQKEQSVTVSATDIDIDGAAAIPKADLTCSSRPRRKLPLILCIVSFAVVVAVGALHWSSSPPEESEYAKKLGELVQQLITAGDTRPTVTGNTRELVQLLSVGGNTTGEASRALIRLGSPAVAEICEAIDRLTPGVETEAEVDLLIGGSVTLAMIAKKEPSAMSDAIPCLLATARRTPNTKARSFIVCQLQLFGPPSVPHLMAYLASVIDDPPSDDPSTMVTQGLVTAAIINMVENDRREIEPVIRELENCLSAAAKEEKQVIILQTANLSHMSQSVIALLERELESASDRDYRKQVQEALEFAEKNAQK